MPNKHTFSDHMASVQVILYHKHPTSAMTRFFKLADGGVSIGSPLPELSRVVTGEEVNEPSIVALPGAIAAEIEQWLGLEVGTVVADTEYQELVEVPGDILRVYLMRFKTIDPPFREAEIAGASFIALTQARGLIPSELELLRKAYVMIMEG